MDTETVPQETSEEQKIERKAPDTSGLLALETLVKSEEASEAAASAKQKHKQKQKHQVVRSLKNGLFLQKQKILIAKLKKKI